MKKSWLLYLAAAYIGAIVAPRLPFKVPGL